VEYLFFENAIYYYQDGGAVKGKNGAWRQACAGLTP
jgi:hypothetical protein